MKDPRTLLAELLLPRLLSGDLPPALAARVSGWVQRSPALRARYDVSRRAERAAGGPRTAALTGGQRDLLRARLLAELPQPASPRAAALVPLGSGALATACVVAFMVTGTADDLAARGARMASEPIGMKVSCVTSDGARVLGSATGGARQSGARLECPHGSLLAFSATNLSSAPRHAFVVGVASDGGLRWFRPFARDGAALLLPSGEVDRVLPELADTASMRRDERVSLFVLLSDRPFDAEALEVSLSRAAARGLALDRLERLPVDVPLQGRIDLVPVQ